MKKICTLTLFVFQCALCFTQNYATGKRTETYLDASRGNRQIQADVYYPADAAGNDVPVAAGTVQFAVVVFGHGFVISTSSYAWLGDSLSQKGYIVVLPATEGGLTPSHSDFGKDLAFLCAYIPSLNDDAGSFLYQRVMNRSAVGGHSMGGGASYLAASGNTSINAIFNFAAAETNPSAIDAASSVTSPALVFSGSSDCIVPAATQQSMYANIAASCKTYINITDAIHCQYANNNGTCVLGQVLSGCNSSSITPAIVFGKVTYLLIPFLDYYLKGSCAGGDQFIANNLTITGASKLQACTSFPSCGALPVTLQDFYGKAGNDAVTLKWDLAVAAGIKSFVVQRSGDGSMFSELALVKAKDIATNGAASYTLTDPYPYPGNSFYRLQIVNEDGSFSYSPVVKISIKTKQVAITRLYPNPASSILHLQLTSVIKQRLTITISSYTGAILFTNNTFVTAGINETILSLANLAAGYYRVQVRDGKDVVVAGAGIMKE